MRNVFKMFYHLLVCVLLRFKVNEKLTKIEFI